MEMIRPEDRNPFKPPIQEIRHSQTHEIKAENKENKPTKDGVNACRTKLTEKSAPILAPKKQDITAGKIERDPKKVEAAVDEIKSALDNPPKGSKVEDSRFRKSVDIKNGNITTTYKHHKDGDIYSKRVDDETKYGKEGYLKDDYYGIEGNDYKHKQHFEGTGRRTEAIKDDGTKEIHNWHNDGSSDFTRINPDGKVEKYYTDKNGMSIPTLPELLETP